MAEALELSTFMSGVSDLDGELQQLDRGDWAGNLYFLFCVHLSE